MAIDDNTKYGLTGAQIKDLAAKVKAAGGVKTLTEADYNWNFQTQSTTNPNSVALWLLDKGVYTNGQGLRILTSRTNQVQTGRAICLVSEKDSSDAVTTVLLSPDNVEKSLAERVEASGSAIYTTNALSYYVNDLTTSSAGYALDARQGKVLKDLVDSLIIKGAGAPTTATVGTVGQLYEDTTGGDLYQCTAVSGGTYTWEEVGGGGGPTVVQTTGQSTTDVMSQKAATDMVYLNGAKDKIVIGLNATNTNSVAGNLVIGYGAQAWNGYTGTVAIGESAVAGNTSSTSGSVAIGRNANAQASWSVAVGGQSKATTRGEFSIGDPTSTDLYGGTGYRLLTNVHDPVSDHDAATKGYVDANAGPTVVQTTGTSTTDVMSQKAVTDILFASAPTSSDMRIRIGSTQTVQNGSISIGNNAQAYGSKSIVIGNSRVYSECAIGIGGEIDDSSMSHKGSIALGYGSGGNITAAGMMDIGARSSYATNFGYKGTNYRLLTGVHDGENAHDAATYGQIQALEATIQALEARIAALEGNA